ncbi:LapA family protein [Alteriqipengyuania lutimaris]|uniref:LapA family protein n=1 Tax=Alteriqipengyuania lutimaris TaxID=1538146 RepID=UPI0017AF7306|nr:LapA family protein [Alteriqipengyuania lutimaris]MBB3035203.1 hypothetical protein [Alteriqipengyuania lutimaris]
MQIVRTIIWVLILVGVVLFSFFNWREVEVTIWDNLVLETKVPALVIISFLLGFLPTWLYARGVIWSLNRKIRSLEIAAKANSVSAAARESDREEAARSDAAISEPEPEAEPQPEPATPSEDEMKGQDATDDRLSADGAAADGTNPSAGPEETGESGSQDKTTTL